MFLRLFGTTGRIPLDSWNSPCFAIVRSVRLGSIERWNKAVGHRLVSEFRWIRWIAGIPNVFASSPAPLVGIRWIVGMLHFRGIKIYTENDIPTDPHLREQNYAKTLVIPANQRTPTRETQNANTIGNSMELTDPTNFGQYSVNKNHTLPM